MLPVWKRTMDVLLSLIGLVLLSPILLLIAAIIKVSSPGPVLFKQERIGRYGKPYLMWKFRTMRVDAESTVHEKHLNALIASNTPMVKLDASRDPRVFAFGALLRRSCMDELPQFVNVLIGDMTLVGPRPCLPYEAHQYQDWQKRRFDGVPGITGLWQVSGKNRTTFVEMIQLDIAYLENISFWLDVKILFRTIPAIIADSLYVTAVRGAANAR